MDGFREYLKRRGEGAPAAGSTGQAQTRRDRRSSPARVEARKDELDDAPGDLNRSTNRLRQKFDSTDTWIETKVQVEQVMGDARRINQVVGATTTEPKPRDSGVLRSGINDLSRAYGLQPLTFRRITSI